MIWFKPIAHNFKSNKPFLDETNLDGIYINVFCPERILSNSGPENCLGWRHCYSIFQAYFQKNSCVMLKTNCHDKSHRKAI